MDNGFYDHSCLICHRPTLENSSVHSKKRVSNTSLLQGFFNCFHINVPDGDVTDLSTSCHFCQKCVQFISEWSNIQTQMTQLTQRAAQLKSTLSALLLSAPLTQEQRHNEHFNQIFNQRILNSQRVKLPLLLEQTVDDIRRELKKKYSVRVMLDKISHEARVQTLDPLAVPYDNLGGARVHEFGTEDCDITLDKIPLPPVQKLDPLELDPLPTADEYNANEIWDHFECEASFQLPVVPKIDPSSVCDKNEDDHWDHSGFGSHDSDVEYVPSEDELDDEETCERILGMSTDTKENANCDDDSRLQYSVHSQAMQVAAERSQANGCPKRKAEGVQKQDFDPRRPSAHKYGDAVDSSLLDKKKVLCKYEGCELTFTNRKLMWAHHNGKHKVKKCPTCTKKFTLQKHRKHLAVCLGQQHKLILANTCETCKVVFDTNKLKKAHVDKQKIKCSCSEKLISHARRRKAHKLCEKFEVRSCPPI